MWGAETTGVRLYMKEEWKKQPNVTPNTGWNVTTEDAAKEEAREILEVGKKQQLASRLLSCIMCNSVVAIAVPRYPKASYRQPRICQLDAKKIS